MPKSARARSQSYNCAIEIAFRARPLYVRARVRSTHAAIGAVHRNAMQLKYQETHARDQPNTTTKRNEQKQLQERIRERKKIKHHREAAVRVAHSTAQHQHSV